MSRNLLLENALVWVDWLKVDDRFILFEVYILISTEIFGEWNACEVFAPGAVVDGCVVEDYNEDTEDEEHAGKAQDYQYGTSCSRVDSSIEGDVWH